MLVGELVASSVLHADRGPADSILVSLEISDGRVKVEVDDPGAGFEPLASPEPSPGEGHDVVLVDRIADRWGVRSDGVPGVWFEVVVA